MPKHLVMLCPSLIDQGGHEYDYTREVASAANATGVNVTTFIPQAAENMSLPGKIYRVSPPDILPPTLPRKITASLAKLYFYFKTFRKMNNTSTLFFIHTISQKQLALIALAWMLAATKGNALVLFLRHQIGTSLSDSVLIQILSVASRFGVSYVSDSDLLADNLGQRLSCKVDTVPIPLTIPPGGINRQNAQPICSYFGARRASKGFHMLPALIDAAAKTDPRINFNIQAYLHRDAKPEESMTNTVTTLAARKNTTIIDRVLSGEEFAKLVFNSDIALIPYDPNVYSVSTSGNFTMSVVARAVIVTSENTWMARQAKQYKMSRVVLLPWQATPAQIEAAMQKAAKLLQMPDLPSPEEKAWGAQQTAKGLWEAISKNGTIH